MTGFWAGVAAYTIWGLFPVYWKLIQHVPALQILGHRIVWSFVVLILVMSIRGRKGVSGRSAARVAILYAIAAVLIGINWFLYVYAVNAGFIVETSLGYFITPLVNVVLGVVVFREHLRRWQWCAVGLAAAGVVYLTLTYGSVPWIAVGLALSFGTYALVKKTAPLDPLEGLTLETAVLVLPAAAYLLVSHVDGTGSFLRTGPLSDSLLIGGGLVTIVPLLLFATAVRSVPLTVIGILQYIGPTLQFILGVFAFGEPFTRAQLVGFAMVWTALAVFVADGLHARRSTQPVPVLDEGMA
jgi:chloramphenicol-sensitive protein RarD